MGQTHYPSKSWFFKGNFSFKVRKHGQQQQLYLQYKVCWILYKKVSKTTTKFSTKKPFFYFSQFSPPYSTFTCSQNHPYNPQKHSLPLYLSNFASLIFAYNLSNNLHEKYFPTSAIELVQGASREQEARKSYEDWHRFKFPLSSWK